MIPQTSPGAEAPVDYPYPGSAALLADGNLWRVERLNADGTITLSRPGHPGASGRRTCAADELIDPGSRVAGREDAALALRLASALRDRDTVSTHDAVILALDIVQDHKLGTWMATPKNVCAILRDLGWDYRRAHRGSFLWLRAVTTLKCAEAAA